MGKDTDFLNEVKEGFDSDDLEILSAKVLLLKQKQLRIEELNTELEKVSKEERLLSREEIPEFLLSKRLKAIIMEDGTKIEIQEKISLSLPKKDITKRKIAMVWITENGGEGIIKNELRVTEPEESIKRYLMLNKIPFTINADIHYQTLKSFVSGKLGLKKGSLAEVEVSDVPEELNLFIYKETKVK